MGMYKTLAEIIRYNIQNTENVIDYLTRTIYKNKEIPKQVIINELWALYERITDDIDEITNS